ncbi:MULTISPECIES: 7-carboxy-7-deazaguanine synthase QueE [Prosthecochloris]|uniref:7-carboxy-7-deazaguanine synthase n=1 Tax=Prosthecochloris vibrioformis TaxID=1098 RepID=A0A5C4S3P0_PROVB|nr:MULTISPECIES: 7-carboxy-7-deazaguanine synthase QueE [Prosthecochloris]ANT65575.1 7-carboxy-7-deazaguanine synthase [Prosthecochloris sp. CIB 2401]TNJ38044.1 radical SAM protein [Prosthecochloris vibrioformis]
MNGQTLRVNELFGSIQGESRHAGWPCAFVRLSGCSADCRWCDTRYAVTEEGILMTLEEIVGQVTSMDFPLVEVTGGEPLEQEHTPELLRLLADKGFRVLLETGGLHQVRGIDPRVYPVIDLKPPSSGISHRIEQDNLHLALGRKPGRPQDMEFKIVVADREDYLWAKELLARHHLTEHATVSMGTVFGALPPSELASWIIQDRLPVRMQLQIHKYIWPPHSRGK